MTVTTHDKLAALVLNQLRVAIFGALFLLFSAWSASAQVQPTTGAACTPTNTPASVEFGRTTLTFYSADHNAVDQQGALKVADYFGEVQVKGQGEIITNFTIPKSSVFMLQAPAPAGCMGTLLPAMTGLLPSATYTLTFYERSGTGARSDPNVAGNVSRADFFLLSASVPVSPGAVSLVTP